MDFPDDIPDDFPITKGSPMDKIFTGNDRAQEVVMTDRMGKLRFKTYRDLTAYLLMLHHGKKLPEDYTEETPVLMRIDKGRMIADCGSCGGASYIEPTDPFFYCMTCQNAKVGGLLRRVIIPSNLGAICDELLKREVDSPSGLAPTQAAALASGKLPRSWNPEETIAQLKAQREA